MRYVWNYRDDTHEALLTSMVNSAESISIVCPFIREQPIASLLNDVNFTSLRVLTLWSWRSFLSGAAELEAFDLLLRIGAEVRALRSGLHAKVYIVDESSALITSANLTNGGLRGNLECGVLVEGSDVSPLLDHFNMEWRKATPITTDQVSQALSEVSKKRSEWDELLKRLRELEDQHTKDLHGPLSVWTPHADYVVVELTLDQVEFLTRPVRGQGGYQSLLTRLRGNMNGNLLRLSRSDCNRIVRYSTQYGEGGFQARLRSIIELAESFTA